MENQNQNENNLLTKEEQEKVIRLNQYIDSKIGMYFDLETYLFFEVLHKNELAKERIDEINKNKETLRYIAMESIKQLDKVPAKFKVLMGDFVFKIDGVQEYKTNMERQSLIDFVKNPLTFVSIYNIDDNREGFPAIFFGFYLKDNLSEIDAIVTYLPDIETVRSSRLPQQLIFEEEKTMTFDQFLELFDLYVRPFAEEVS
jgi:hypothetical protein